MSTHPFYMGSVKVLQIQNIPMTVFILLVIYDNLSLLIIIFFCTFSDNFPIEKKDKLTVSTSRCDFNAVLQTGNIPTKV